MASLLAFLENSKHNNERKDHDVFFIAVLAIIAIIIKFSFFRNFHFKHFIFHIYPFHPSEKVECPCNPYILCNGFPQLEQFSVSLANCIGLFIVTRLSNCLHFSLVHLYEYSINPTFHIFYDPFFYVRYNL